MANKGIERKFNPPGASHFGGFYEALIKSSKRAINAVLGNADITDEELLTEVTRAEGLLNSRPLMYQSSDPEDEPVLTPNHFLHGQCGGQLAPKTVEDSSKKTMASYSTADKKILEKMDRELSPMLNIRTKWTVKLRDLAVGDMVICFDQNLLRGKWPLDRIEEAYLGPDGHVRVPKVHVGKNLYTRPITKLCLLELDSRF